MDINQEGAPTAACGKPAQAAGRGGNCDQQSYTFKAGDNNYVIFISHAAGPCNNKPFTDCFRCWPQPCYRCLVLYSKGETWGPFACGECRDRLESNSRAQDSTGRAEESGQSRRPAAYAGASYVINAGLGASSEGRRTPGLTSTEGDSESIVSLSQYSGNLDSPPSTQHDSLYSTSLGSVSSGTGWNDGRVSADGGESTKEFTTSKPLPSLIPLGTSLATCMGEPAPAMGFITDFSANEIFAMGNLFDYSDADGPLFPEDGQGTGVQTAGEPLLGRGEADIKMDEGTGDGQPRGEKTKEEATAMETERELHTPPPYRFGDGSTVEKPSESPATSSVSSLGPPKDTTASYLVTPPTKCKPPSITMETSDSEGDDKRGWFHDRKLLEDNGTWLHDRKRLENEGRFKRDAQKNGLTSILRVTPVGRDDRQARKQTASRRSTPEHGRGGGHDPSERSDRSDRPERSVSYKTGRGGATVQPPGTPTKVSKGIPRRQLSFARSRDLPQKGSSRMFASNDYSSKRMRAENARLTPEPKERAIMEELNHADLARREKEAKRRIQRAQEEIARLEAERPGSGQSNSSHQGRSSRSKKGGRRK